LLNVESSLTSSLSKKALENLMDHLDKRLLEKCLQKWGRVSTGDFGHRKRPVNHYATTTALTATRFNFKKDACAKVINL